VAVAQRQLISTTSRQLFAPSVGADEYLLIVLSVADGYRYADFAGDNRRWLPPPIIIKHVTLSWRRTAGAGTPLTWAPTSFTLTGLTTGKLYHRRRRVMLRMGDLLF
jgi:hypothetical protein